MKPNIVKVFFLLFIVACLCFKSYSQDPVFTQFYNIPDYLNPSFTGFSKGTKVGIINRTQWFGLNYGLNSQFFFIDNYFGDDAETGVGLGLNIMNHHESVTRYNFTQVNLNYAHHLKLSKEWYFNPSLTVGLGVKDYTFDYLLEDQILIFQGIINANSNDPILLNDSLSFFDMSAGLLFYTENIWFGASLKHLTNPKISFTGDGTIKLDHFLSVHGGYKWDLSNRSIREDLDLNIDLNYMRQGNYDRFDLGTRVKYNDFSLGVFGVVAPTDVTGRSHKLTSFNIVGNIDFDRFRFGYSYDLNVSELRNTKGVFEISISYKFDSFFGNNGPNPCECM